MTAVVVPPLLKKAIGTPVRRNIFVEPRIINKDDTKIQHTQPQLADDSKLFFRFMQDLIPNNKNIKNRATTKNPVIKPRFKIIEIKTKSLSATGISIAF